MSFRITARPKAGPFRFNTGTRGLTSVTLKLGPVSWRLWSRTGRTGLSSVDLPGPLSWRAPAKPLTEKAARRRRRRALLAGAAVVGLVVAAVAGWPGWTVVAMAALWAVLAVSWVRLSRRRTGTRVGAR
jgi:TRAP-type C4-dicarboxylate transport system permease small subunit